MEDILKFGRPDVPISDETGRKIGSRAQFYSKATSPPNIIFIVEINANLETMVQASHINHGKHRNIYSRTMV